MNAYFAAAIVWSLAVCFSGGLQAQEAHSESEEAEGDHALFVHPFAAHMGLPDAPNEISLRLTGFRQRFEGATRSDLAVHIEAGLGRGFGLHLRTDGIRGRDYSEVMLQYALLGGREMRNGLAVIGELEVPTGAVEDNALRALIGLSSRLTAPGIMVFDTTVHYDPAEASLGYESSFVFRAGPKFFPLVEVRGHVHDEIETYILTGIKFKAGRHSAFGVAVQTAVSGHREYDNQALLTYSASF